MEPVYIFGHKNPDTDSICSAIAYAYLKNRQAEGNIPPRLGDLSRETLFVLRNDELLILNSLETSFAHLRSDGPPRSDKKNSGVLLTSGRR